jgi:putative protein-disulfide isomerase
MQLENNQAQNDTGIEITFYTDPLCCWSWAMRPQWDRLQAEVNLAPTRIMYKMGGLLPSWDHFADSVNSIRKPIQMGPEWLHAKAISGQPFNDTIWITDPPASSFPACIAVKSVELQSAPLAALYLNDLQRAVMDEGRNISNSSVLLEIALDLSIAYPSFDLSRFREDLFGEGGKAAFRADLQECKYLNIIRLPTLVFKGPAKRPVLMTGYQSYEVLKAAWLKISL